MQHITNIQYIYYRSYCDMAGHRNDPGAPPSSVDPGRPPRTPFHPLRGLTGLCRAVAPVTHWPWLSAITGDFSGNIMDE